MATAGRNMEGAATTPQRLTRVLIFLLVLTIGLTVGGVIGRITASPDSPADRSTTTRISDRVSTTLPGARLTSADLQRLGLQLQQVHAQEFRAWERGCSPRNHPSANVC
jgi:hypothetical protein